MQGNIAQVIVLTVYGNAALAGTPGFDPADFYPSNSTFGFCEYVNFVDLRRRGEMWEEIAYAMEPRAWLERLRKERVSALRLRYGSGGDQQVADRMLVGLVGGGGRWLIEANGPNGVDYWEARWEIGDRDHVERKIWRVTYGRIASRQPLSQDDQAELETLKKQLRNNLEAIAEFARAHDLDGFAKAFESGLARLSSYNSDRDQNHNYLVPAELLPPAASQLLGAAQAAWVFGGMGSWNDLSFSGRDQTRYDRLSEELYQLLNQAIVTAANAGIGLTPPRPPRPWWQIWK